MSKKQLSVLFACAFLVCGVFVVMSDTTFKWSNPASANGTLSYYELAITNTSVPVAFSNVTLYGSLTASGYNTDGVMVASSLSVTGATTLGTSTTSAGTLGITGASTLNTLVVTGATAQANGALYVNGAVGLGVASNKVTVAAATGNTAIKGTLVVDGAGTFGGTLAVSNTLSCTNISSLGTLGVTGDVGFGTGTNRAAIVGSSGNFKTVGEVTIDSKYAVVGPDVTTPLEIQTGTFTNNEASVTYGHIFGAGTVRVMAYFTDDLSSQTGTNCGVFATTITTTNFVPKYALPLLQGGTNCAYIAIGPRP